jgi:hypothetical protein
MTNRTLLRESPSLIARMVARGLVKMPPPDFKRAAEDAAYRHRHAYRRLPRTKIYSRLYSRFKLDNKRNPNKDELAEIWRQTEKELLKVKA